MRRETQPFLNRLDCGPVRRGVSLLELLVVIAIISLMVSMLVPSLKRSMQLARDAMCMNNLRQQFSAVQMYRMDNDGWLPMGESKKRKDWLGVAKEEETPPWFGNLFPTYMNNPLVLTCPEDPYQFLLAQNRSRIHDADFADLASYGINSFMMNAGNGFLGNVDRYQPSRPLDTILLADLGPDDDDGEVFAAPRPGRRVHGPKRNAARLSWDDGYDPFSPVSTKPWVTLRHGVGINVVTLGGNVRDARTVETIRSPVRSYYTNGAVGGCTMCNELRVQHYSFARDNLFWWTGATPSE